MRGSRCIYGHDMDHPLQTLQSAGRYARIAWRGVSWGLRGELAAEGAVAGVASVQSVGVHSAGVDCWLRAGRAEVGEDDIEVVDIDLAVVVGVGRTSTICVRSRTFPDRRPRRRCIYRYLIARLKAGPSCNIPE